ncbi:unnamed protein product, partial [Trichobilharzia szidati]
QFSTSIQVENYEVLFDNKVFISDNPNETQEISVIPYQTTFISARANFEHGDNQNA